MSWRIVLVDEVRDWLHELRRTDKETLLSISAALDVLGSRGPALGRPLADSVRGSNLPHLKELRPGSQGSTEVRILFAFDPERNAVLLIGGDKSDDWSGWYKGAIPVAESRYKAHLEVASDGQDNQERRRR